MLIARRYFEIHRENTGKLFRKTIQERLQIYIYLFKERDLFTIQRDLFIRDHIQRDLFMADGKQVVWSNALHSARGSGSGSRSRLDFA